MDLEKEVLKRIEVDQGTKCAHWTGSMSKKKPVLYAEGKRVWVRSAVYELRKGLIPKGKYVEMVCGNWDCVNSKHMELRLKVRPCSTATR